MLLNTAVSLWNCIGEMAIVPKRIRNKLNCWLIAVVCTEVEYGEYVHHQLI